MNWFPFFRPAQRAQQIEDLALEVAERCEDAVRARLGPQVASMNVSEARGYVRARAGGAVRRETGVMLSSRKDLSTSLRPVLVRRATDQVVLLVAGNLTTNGNFQTAARQAS